MADGAILEAAIIAQPDYLVTGDNHFLDDPNLTKETGLRIITPTRFLQVLEQA